jgi:hypothetical protein
METQNISDRVSSLSENVNEYLNLRLGLLKLTATEKLANLLSHLMISLILFVLIILILFFITFAFISWFGENAGPAWAGSLVAAGFYILAGILIYLLRYPLFINPLIAKISRVMLEDENDE